MGLTMKDAAALIGSKRLVEFSGMLNGTKSTVRVPCTVSNVRSAFGRTDLEVQPINGTGTVWVSKDRTDPIDEPIAPGAGTGENP